MARRPRPRASQVPLARPTGTAAQDSQPRCHRQPASPPARQQDNDRHEGGEGSGIHGNLNLQRPGRGGIAGLVEGLDADQRRERSQPGRAAQHREHDGQRPRPRCVLAGPGRGPTSGSPSPPRRRGRARQRGPAAEVRGARPGRARRGVHPPGQDRRPEREHQGQHARGTRRRRVPDQAQPDGAQRRCEHQPGRDQQSGRVRPGRLVPQDGPPRRDQDANHDSPLAGAAPTSSANAASSVWPPRTWTGQRWMTEPPAGRSTPRGNARRRSPRRSHQPHGQRGHSAQGPPPPRPRGHSHDRAG